MAEGGGVPEARARTDLAVAHDRAQIRTTVGCTAMIDALRHLASFSNSRRSSSDNDVESSTGHRSGS